jgi:hypothetical protein
VIGCAACEGGTRSESLFCSFDRASAGRKQTVAQNPILDSDGHRPLDLVRAADAVAGNRRRLECREHSLAETQGPGIRFDRAAACADVVCAFLWRRQYGSTTPPIGNQPIIYSDIQITVTGTSPGTAIDAGQNTIVALVVDWAVT